MLHVALCFICEHCVFGQVRVSFELFNRPFWSNLDPKPCCEELLGCSRELWGDKLLNSGPLQAQGGFRNRPAHVSRSIVESFCEPLFDLEAALGSFCSHSRLDVAVLEFLVCKTATKCANYGG